MMGHDDDGCLASDDLVVAYFDEVIALLARIRDDERGSLRQAADLLADALANGRSAFVFGSGHSALPAMDVVYRSGGLMLLNPLVAPGLTGPDARPVTLGTALERLPGYATAVLDASPVRRDDVLVVVSVSGRNAVPVEMAREARRRGVHVVGVVSRAYVDAVATRDPSGSKLPDHCDVVIDDKVPYGDAVLSADGLDVPFAAASGVVNAAVMQALVAATVAGLLRRGVVPPVFRSVNVDGGAEANAEHVSRERHRIHYL